MSDRRLRVLTPCGCSPSATPKATAIYAADAVSRLSNSSVVGVAVLDASPGLTGALSAVKNAQLDQARRDVALLSR